MEEIILLKDRRINDALALWEASVRATHDFLAEGDVDFFRPYVKHYLESAPIHCVESVDGKLLAIMGVTNSMVDMLFVHPENIGGGFGRKLLNFAVNQLAANRVDVNEQNTRAVAFYVKNGFSVTCRSVVDGFGKLYPILHLSIIKDTETK